MDDRIELDGEHWIVRYWGKTIGGFKTAEDAEQFLKAAISQGITKLDGPTFIWGKNARN